MKQESNMGLGQLCCPNCTRHLCGILDKSGGLKIICNRCGARIYSKPIGIRTYLIKITSTE